MCRLFQSSDISHHSLSFGSEQVVQILIVPVGYTSDDVSYRWTTGRGVNIASDMKLSQFDLISTPTGNETTTRSKGKSLESLKYLNTSIEDHVDEVGEYYDAVVASEVIEHVDNQEMFVSKCSSVCKSSGSLFMTTISKTQLSWLVAIVGAEYVLRLLPTGTHEWDKFITPQNLR